jgi:hypothetical protein
MSPLLILLAVLAALLFGAWFVSSLFERKASAAIGWRGPAAIFVSILLVVGVVVRPGILTLNPLALIEESRAGVTRSDVRDQLREMERNVPSILDDMESHVPDMMADMEREMMRDAYKYGLSPSDVQAQIRSMEYESRQQIRDMKGDVRRQIRDLEEPTWEVLRKVGY